MTTGQFDQQGLRAIRVLAEAVRRERVPGVVEFRLLTGFLEKAIDDSSDEELDLASAAFDALDVEFRRRIADRALVLADQERGDRPTIDRSPPPPRRAKAATGFLTALNHHRAAKGESPPRSVARSRLLADVAGDGEPAERKPAFDGPPPKWWAPEK
ncbi:hypothetical protein HL658_28215 [Azospirillum sp. RWY-5-1]|uniref:Uncharacterized protein n=1 Tax=Azospirillum oleiclasticum TaxID=2735135 RepID=A0ABX2TL73_9PROT|nr:hypothetical protein [Azospirillum oleiclasticum]NYZ16446.1 hypothetical protein [Azospirillum oleiclasticum]NYZ23838.1 hypothetical protein [Azospirillum oleiclasticum]